VIYKNGFGRRRERHLRLALAEEQLPAGLDELRVRDEFELDRCAVARTQSLLRMVDLDYADGLSDSLWYW
jgi:hypothetical protein